jgi:spermidine synthase
MTMTKTRKTNEEISTKPPYIDLVYSQRWDDNTKISIKINRHIYTEQTPYQRIDFYESDTYGTFFTLDGLVMVTQKDEFIYHEMITHVAMATNPAIKKVLIIGGGDGGTSREIARYPHVERIDMVDIDERVTRLCQQYLPQTAGHLDKDPRIHLNFQDGSSFVGQVEDGFYDLIIVDSTDPIGVGEGLFTTQFYQSCLRVMAEDGILINQHESPYYQFHIEEMKKAHKKIRDLFPIVQVYQYHIPTYPSGHWLFGFASKKYDALQDHKPEIWEAMGLETKYYNSNIHKGAFALPTYVLDLLKSSY